MTPSATCADFIKRFEQCRLTAYMPTPKDVPTIGWGSTGPDIHLGLKWTQAQADERFARDLAQFGNGVANAIGGHPTTQGQFDALVSCAYNIGIEGLAGSTLLKKHKAADYDGAAAQFGLWTKQKGKVLAGLVKRRASEARIYRGLPA